jgi:zinc protease
MSLLIKPEEIVLSSGIPVVIQDYPGAVAATYWWVRTGSADESSKEAGFAHFLEHMLFKDAAAKETGRASTGRMARAIESLGGDINAYTSFDQTVYHVTCASQHWERILDEFGSMGRPQRFLNSDFQREREVILEELRKNNDSPGRQLFQALFTNTFNKHPYGRPVIGYVKTLKAANVQGLEAFYRRNYVPANMGVVLVGPAGEPGSPRRKNILKLLEKHFGKAVQKSRAIKKASRSKEPELRKEIAVEVKAFDVKTPTLAISFRAPELSHPDIPALDLLSGILSMGELSRLYQSLFYGSSLVTDVSGGLYVPKDVGMLYFQTETQDLSRVQEVARKLFEELARIGREGPNPEELARVLTNAESERLYSTQTADGMAGRLGFLKFIIGELDFDDRYLAELQAVDAKRIQEVARRYLDWRRMSICMLVPKEHAEFDARPIAQEAKRALNGESAAPMPKLKLAGSRKTQVPEVFELSSGLRVLYRPNSRSHVMSLHAAALGGLRLELATPGIDPSSSWGSSSMMSLTWTKGTGGLISGSAFDAREIASRVEGRAASMDGFAGRNTVGLQLTGLARDWSDLSGLFVEALIDPVFPDDEVGHSRRVAEDSVRGIEDHSSQLCSKLFLQTLYEHHPYGHLTTGSLESLARIDSARLRQFHRAWMRPERIVIAVAGNVRRGDLESWMEQVNGALEKLPRQSELEVPRELREEPDLKAPRWIEKKLGREQLHILVGGLGTRIGSEDRYAIRLMQNILGGQSGRLFIELREKKSLAYTVAPLNVEGVERGYIGTYIACSPGKREEAIQGIAAVHQKLAEKGPTASEMKRAQEFYLGRRAMELQSDSSVAAHHGLEEIYRLPHLDEDEIARRVRAVSPKQIQEACRRYIVAPHLVTSVVG